MTKNSKGKSSSSTKQQTENESSLRELKEKKEWSYVGLFADTISGFLTWSLITHLPALLTFLGLNDIAFTGFELTFVCYVTPAFLSYSWLSSFSFNNYWLFKLLSVVGLFSIHLPNIYHQLTLIFIAISFDLIGLFSLWLNSPLHRRNQSIFGFLCGFILLNIVKFAFFSMNPVWLYHENDPNPIYQAINTLCIFLGVMISAYYFTEQRSKGHIEPLSFPWVFSALAIGSLFFGTHRFFNGYGVLARWVDIPTFPSGIIVILVCSVGVLLSETTFSKSPVWWIVTGIAGWYLMIFNPESFNVYVQFGGGLLMALYFFSIWMHVISKVLHAHNIGKTLFFAFLMFFLLHIWDLYNVGYKFFPGGVYLRERSISLSFIPVFFSGIPLLFISKPLIGTNLKYGFNFVLVLLLLGLGPVSYYRFTIHKMPSPITDLSEIRAGVSCIHLGWGNNGQFPMDDWADVLIKNQVNVLGIFETDGMRSIMDNRDPVEYLNNKVHYTTEDYGPPTSQNTWGCAFLTLFPVKRSEKLKLPSPQGELSCGVDADIIVNNTVVRVITAHFGNTEDTEDLELQTQDIVERVKESSDPKDIRPLIFISYITTKPFSPRHVKLIQSGLIDATTSLDRYCLYTMYRDINLVNFQRLDKGIRSDTEIQYSVFQLSKKKYIPPSKLPSDLCASHFNDSTRCQATYVCGWCQIGHSGLCYEPNSTNYLGCLNFNGAWAGPIPDIKQQQSTKEDLDTFVKTEISLQSKAIDHVDYVSTSDLDVIWYIQNFAQIKEFTEFYTSPIFSIQGHYWRLRTKTDSESFGVFVDYFPSLPLENWSISGKYNISINPLSENRSKAIYVSRGTWLKPDLKTESSSQGPSNFISLETFLSEFVDDSTFDLSIGLKISDLTPLDPVQVELREIKKN